MKNAQEDMRTKAKSEKDEERKWWSGGGYEETRKTSLSDGWMDEVGASDFLPSIHPLSQSQTQSVNAEAKERRTEKENPTTEGTFKWRKKHSHAEMDGCENCQNRMNE